MGRIVRIPIYRQLENGIITDGTAEIEIKDDGIAARDFRDLEGRPLDLPSGASFMIEPDWPALRKGL